MLLQRLKEYADAGRVENMAPVGYKETPIRYVVGLDHEGRFLGCIDQTQGTKGREKRGKPTIAPHVGRASSVRAKLLADNAEYALGLARNAEKQGRVDECHRAFTDLVRTCASATREPSVAAVLSFLEAGATADDQLPADFDPSMVVTFRVGDTLPMDLPSVRSFWAERSGSVAVTDSADNLLPGEGSGVMQCLVCGQRRPAMERLAYKWQGIPGGQTAGLAIISANEDAFLSYGLEASLIAPTCADCGERFSKSANALLADRRTSLRIGPLAYIFWTREAIPFSIVGLLTDPTSEDVRALFQSPRSGHREAAALDDMPFYAAALSASRARVVVRDWLDTTVGRAKKNLLRYFELQHIVGPDGTDAPLKLVALAGATVRELKDLKPTITRSLLRAALAGGPVPINLLFAAVRRCHVEGGVTRRHAALIKMVLLSNSPGDVDKGELAVESELVQLDPSNRDPAYLCGRLLAVLEAIQRAALGDINATIVDRYYGTASSAPASVFGRLLRGAQPHLGKLRRDPRKQGAFFALQNRLMDVMNEGTGLREFPLVLTLPNQGLFALGYYHQRAADRAGARANRELKALVSNTETGDEPATDGDPEE